jgi:hypothetical protein
MGFWKNLLNIAVERIELKTEVPLWKSKAEGLKTIYEGFFRIYDRRGKPTMKVQGRIVVWNTFPSEVYLYDPPVFLTRHKHGSCLQLLKPNDKWFKLHFEHNPKDFSSAYGYVEQMLSEGYCLNY